MSKFFISECVLDGAGARIQVGGEIDHATSPQLSAGIAEALELSRPLVLDLSSTTFVDSTAIGVLVDASERVDAAGLGPLAIVCADERVLRIFEMTGLDRVVALWETAEEARSGATTSA